MIKDTNVFRIHRTNLKFGAPDSARISENELIAGHPTHTYDKQHSNVTINEKNGGTRKKWKLMCTSSSLWPK